VNSPFAYRIGDHNRWFLAHILANTLEATAAALLGVFRVVMDLAARKGGGKRHASVKV